MSSAESFLADGAERARRGLEQEIRASVLAEFAPRLQAANWWQRLLLKADAECEIECRLKGAVKTELPPDALY